MPTHRQLCAMNFTELKGLYDQADAVDIAGLSGCYHGNAYGLPGISALPRVVRLILHWLINALNLFWRGKSLNNGQGKNLWLVLNERLGFATYTYQVDSHGNLRLDYQHQQNPQAVQGLHASLRRLDAETLLGMVAIAGRSRLFFTLSQPCHA